MSRVFYLSDVLQFVIYGFNECSFSQAYLIRDAHERILHIVLHFGYQLYAIYEKVFEQSLAYIPFVSKELAFYIFQQHAILQGLSVIDVPCCEHEIQYFSFIIDNQMQLKPEESSHRTFPSACKSLKGLMHMDALVTAYSQWGTVDKTYPRTFSEQNLLDENRQLQENLFL